MNFKWQCHYPNPFENHTPQGRLVANLFFFFLFFLPFNFSKFIATCGKSSTGAILRVPEKKSCFEEDCYI